MVLRVPFSTKQSHSSRDERTISHARAELISAESAVVSARAAYLRMWHSHQQPTALQPHQSALDQALRRYHSARHVLRALDRADLGLDLRPFLPPQHPRFSSWLLARFVGLSGRAQPMFGEGQCQEQVIP